jgi:hypothetical protein
VNVQSSKLTTLADGKTFAVEAIVTAKIMIVNLWGYPLGVNKGGTGIVISGFTLGDQDKKTRSWRYARPSLLSRAIQVD